MFGKEWNHSRVKSFKEWDRCLGCKQVYWVVLCTLSAINALKRALLHQEFVLHGSCWPGLAFVAFERQWWALGCPELRKRHFIAFLWRSWLSLKSPPDRFEIKGCCSFAYIIHLPYTTSITVLCILLCSLSEAPSPSAFNALTQDRFSGLERESL